NLLCLTIRPSPKFTLFPYTTLFRSKRLSASHAYLDPAKHRANLDIETLAFVTKINFEGKKATGVTYRRGKHYKTVTAEKIVLAGGAINTPQLLQLSGV